MDSLRLRYPITGHYMDLVMERRPLDMTHIRMGCLRRDLHSPYRTVARLA